MEVSASSFHPVIKKPSFSSLRSLLSDTFSSHSLSYAVDDETLLLHVSSSSFHLIIITCPFSFCS